MATGGTITTDPGELVSAALAGPVNLGKLDLPANVDLAKATSIKAGGAVSGVEISAPKASPVQLNGYYSFCIKWYNFYNC